MNEKAFGGALAKAKTGAHETSAEGRASTSASPRVGRSMMERGTPLGSETPLPNEPVRPATPPADYDLENLHLNDKPASHRNANQRAAVF